MAHIFQKGRKITGYQKSKRPEDLTFDDCIQIVETADKKQTGKKK